MNGKIISKILGVGLLNFALRFMIGGVLFLGIKVNPEGIVFGASITIAAFIIALLLLRYVMRPATRPEALRIAMVWIAIALLLDIVTARPVVGVTIGHLLAELQTWTRLLAVAAAALIAVKTPRHADTTAGG